MPPAFSQQRRLIAATIRFFDLFSGIGGFREGLRRAGGFTCVGHCEVDAYADKNYRLLFDTEGEWFCNDARTIETERMVYTGPIDAYFDYKLGALEYRSVRFETELLEQPNFQGNAAEIGRAHV